MAHDIELPSPWVLRWARLMRVGEALDLACGRGRHARHLASLGHQVTAVDRDADVLAALAGVARVRTIRADLEGGSPWPLPGRQFQGIVVTNYLHRPLFARLVDALAPGGVLVYETFAVGNERFGKPSNPEFLLRAGELLEAFGSRMTVAAFEQGRIDAPRLAVVQRFCGVRSPADEIALEIGAQDR